MAAQPESAALPRTGTLKSFGSTGPMYEVIGPAANRLNRGQTVMIRVFGTGEVLDYPLQEFMTDPEAV